MKKTNQNKCILALCSGSEGHEVRELLSKIGDKWSLFIIVKLAESKNSTARFSELQKSINGISQKMLTTTLRNLERDGMVIRHFYPEIPPRVEYELTALGEELLVPVKSLTTWISMNWPSIKKARDKFDDKAVNKTNRNAK